MRCLTDMNFLQKNEKLTSIKLKQSDFFINIWLVLSIKSIRYNALSWRLSLKRRELHPHRHVNDITVCWRLSLKKWARVRVSFRFSASYFFLCGQENVTKKKATPTFSPTGSFAKLNQLNAAQNTHILVLILLSNRPDLNATAWVSLS